MADAVAVSIEAVFREERGRLLASLVRQFRDLDLAEDVASEAIEAALVRWPVDGIPPRPGGWLLTTARRRAVDRLRRDKSYAARLAVLQVEAIVPPPVRRRTPVRTCPTTGCSCSSPAHTPRYRRRIVRR